MSLIIPKDRDSIPVVPILLSYKFKYKLLSNNSLSNA